MGFFYLDSSVMVKRYVDEPGSAWVRLLITEPENVAILSEIAIVEVSAALAMSVRTGKLRKTLGQAAYEAFHTDIAAGVYQLLAVARPTIDEAAELAQAHCPQPGRSRDHAGLRQRRRSDVARSRGGEPDDRQPLFARGHGWSEGRETCPTLNRQARSEVSSADVESGDVMRAIKVAGEAAYERQITIPLPRDYSNGYSVWEQCAAR